jgi:hypothetical protein
MASSIADDDHPVDRLFASDRVGDLQQFQPVCTDCHCPLLSVMVPSGRSAMICSVQPLAALILVRTKR